MVNTELDCENIVKLHVNMMIELRLLYLLIKIFFLDDRDDEILQLSLLIAMKVCTQNGQFFPTLL